MNNVNENINEALRNYVWNYFQVHASQRLTTFNFYILISTVIATGYIIAVKNVYIPVLAIACGIILILLSFVFWKLDLRNKQLIKNAEEALKYLESKDKIEKKENEPHILNIFTFEEMQTNKIKQNESIWPWKKLYTYSTCFSFVFLIFGVFGLLGIIYAVVILLARI